jgi:hypothetical protein
MPAARWTLIAAACFLLALSALRAVAGGSVDMAHHYALAYRLFEHWSLPSIYDPSLGEMNFYPRLGHLFAALAGRAAGSVFIGLHFTALLSLALTWGAILAIVNTLPARSAQISSVALAILAFANNRLQGPAFHGGELITNYFFSQLVAQAAFFAALAMAMLLEYKGRKIFAFFFLTPCIYFCTSIHLLPAIELLGVLCILLAIDLIASPPQKSELLKALVQAAAIASVALTCLVLNPAFGAMRKIADNNGDLHIALVSYSSGMIWLALFVLGASTSLLRAWFKADNRQQHMALKYLGAWGASIALLCLLQIVLANLGYGSHYAAKKYVFGLTTFTAVFLCICIGHFASGMKSEQVNPATRIHLISREIVVLLPLCCIFLSVIHAKKVLDTSAIAAMERRLAGLARTSLPAPPPGKSNVIIDLPASALPVVNYMFSIAIAKTTSGDAIRDVLIANELSDLGRYVRVVGGAQSRRYVHENCRLDSPGSLAVMDAACLDTAIRASNVCAGVMDFSSNGLVDQRFLQGFSAAEAGGRWTSASHAEFTCLAGERKPESISLLASPFLLPSSKRQRVRISVNGEKLGDFEFKDPNGASIRIDMTSTKQQAKYVFSIELPDAISPKAAGINPQDDRKLGLSFKTVTFD